MGSAARDDSLLRELRIDPKPAAKLVDRLERLVSRGEIPSGQLALARDGRVAVTATCGEATLGGSRARTTDDTLYATFSTTKAVTASAIWVLLQERKLSIGDRVADRVPEFAGNGKDAVTVEQLLTHTSGFPNAPFDALEWEDPERRLARFASWRLEWEPGSRFQYHGTSGMWVLAELIERTSGADFRTFIRERVTGPLGLSDLHLGIAEEHLPRVADVENVGTAPDVETVRAAGLDIPEQFVADNTSLIRMNDDAVRAVGIPGGGALATAASFALFYQALLRGGAGADGTRVWDPAILEEALRERTGDLTDPMTGRRAYRGLGVVLAGDEHRVFRSFAPENSETAFGHPGAGGQVAWADPATGISFAFFTNGLDRNPLAMGGRGLALSSLAARCAG